MSQAFVSRGGEKLAAALDGFNVDVTGRVCADLGSHVGGFVDCLLQRGAAKVYAVDTCYGTLAWKLRRDPRVVVRERTNAMHVTLPEQVDLVTVDVAWTPQARILPNAARLVLPTGTVVTLIKPHYEASRAGSARRNREPNSADEAQRVGRAPPAVPDTLGPAHRSPHASRPATPDESPLIDGVLPDDAVDAVVQVVLEEIRALGWTVRDTFPSPIPGHAGNREVFGLLTR